MYCATVDGDVSGCVCGDHCDGTHQLGSYSFSSPFQTQYYTPGFGTSGQLSPFSPSPILTNQLSVTGVLNAAGDILQDLGRDALDWVQGWLSREIGEQAWRNAPDETKREWVQVALEDYGGRAGALLSSPVVLVGGTLLGAWLLSGRSSRRRR